MYGSKTRRCRGFDIYKGKLIWRVVKIALLYRMEINLLDGRAFFILELIPDLVSRKYTRLSYLRY